MSSETREPVWMDVLEGAVVEVSSEDELFPVTAALGHAVTHGWRAAVPGCQTVRLLLHKARRLERIRVHVIDRVSERTQEIRVSAGASIERLTEVARWEFLFSPRGMTEWTEEMPVGMDDVAVVELRIEPDAGRSGGADQMYASLTQFWLA